MKTLEYQSPELIVITMMATRIMTGSITEGTVAPGVDVLEHDGTSLTF